MPFGVVIGASYIDMDISARGIFMSAGVPTPYKQTTTANEWTQYYAQFTSKGFRLDAEYRRDMRDTNLFRTATPTKSISDSRTWYVSGTYRVCKLLELGAYRSQYFVDTRKDTTPPSAHEFDTTISARLDPIDHWYVKVEGHFIDGASTTTPAARGFYTLSNPTGILPTTRLLVIRTGFSF